MLADSLLANPPPFEDILSIFVEEDWIHFQHDPAVLTRRCHNFYAGYGAGFRLRSILEIGVRRGYSAFALVNLNTKSRLRPKYRVYQKRRIDMVKRNKDTRSLNLRSVRRKTVAVLYEAKAQTGKPICHLVDLMVVHWVEKHPSMLQMRQEEVRRLVEEFGAKVSKRPDVEDRAVVVTRSAPK